MKKVKTFDAVQFQRDARDKLYQEIKDMTPSQQIEYINTKALLFIKEVEKKGHGT